MRIARLFPLLCVFATLHCFAGGYQVKIKITGIKDSTSILAHHYGSQQILTDTAKFDAKGELVFDGKKDLPGGIYIVTLPGKKYFELIIDKEQVFSLATDTEDMVKHMKVTNSPSNKAFYDYLNFISARQKQIVQLRQRLSANASNKDSTAILGKKLKGIDEEVKKYKGDFTKKNPDALLSKVFSIMQDAEPPAPPLLGNGRPDSLFAFHYIQKHYFDQVDFNDERIVRTPVLQIKYAQYFENFVFHHPDSISKAADMLAEKTRANKELFKFTVHYVTSTYETSKIMGMDAVFVHMAEKYYMTRQAFWVDSIQLSKIVTRALRLKPTLIDKPAPEILMPDSNGKPVSLLSLKSKYTAIFFWNYDCHHCQESAEKLIKIYRKYQPKGFEVYAVETEPSFEPWKKYIHEHKYDWTNVCDPKMESNFRAWYDVYMTPLLMLIDEKKKIVAKQITPEQLDDILSRRLK